MAEETSLQRLRSVHLFTGLSKKDLRAVLQTGKEVEFPAGVTIAAEGSAASDFYLILEGTARVFVGGRGKRALRAGDYFGEMSVIDGGPRTATVSAVTRVSALRLNRRAFRSLLRTNASVSRMITLELVGRLRAAERSLTH
jgi:CRP/FNR family transcriptional regulator, cyclic AMP receptor protein